MGLLRRKGPAPGLALPHRRRAHVPAAELLAGAARRMARAAAAPAQGALRLIGGLRSVNVMSVEWIHAGERLRGVFQLAEPPGGWVERLGEKGLRIRSPAADFPTSTGSGSLPASPWTPFTPPMRKPERAWISICSGRPANWRSSSEPSARSWAFTAELPARPGFYEPEFEGEMSEIEPDIASDHRISRIILDPGHGGEDPGAISATTRKRTGTCAWPPGSGPRSSGRDSRSSGRCARMRAARPPSGPRRPRREGDLYLTCTSRAAAPRGPRGSRSSCKKRKPAPGKRGPGGLGRRLRAARRDQPGSGLAAPADPERAQRLAAARDPAGSDRHPRRHGHACPHARAGQSGQRGERAAWEDEPTREQRLRALAQALAGRASGEERKRHWWERAGSEERR